MIVAGNARSTYAHAASRGGGAECGYSEAQLSLE